MNNGHHFFTPLNITKQPPTAGLKKQHKPIQLPITLSSLFFFLPIFLALVLNFFLNSIMFIWVLSDQVLLTQKYLQLFVISFCGLLEHKQAMSSPFTLKQFYFSSIEIFLHLSILPDSITQKLSEIQKPSNQKNSKLTLQLKINTTFK